MARIKTKAAYANHLKNPLWQRKRLEIFQRDDFTCQHCSATGKPLNVHHKKYAGSKPWEIDSCYLITLCEDCHAKEPNRIELEASILGNHENMNGFTSLDLLKVNFIFGSLDYEKNITPFIDRMLLLIDKDDRFSDYYRTHYSQTYSAKSAAHIENTQK